MAEQNNNNNSKKDYSIDLNGLEEYLLTTKQEEICGSDISNEAILYKESRRNVYIIYKEQRYSFLN